jgi:tetratricopeptide (TPR) repeat protein
MPLRLDVLMSGSTKFLSRWTAWPIWLPIILLSVASAPADDLSDAQTLFRTGNYDQCIRACEKAADYPTEEWSILHGQALLTVGKYPQAETVISNAIERTSASVRLRWLGVETANFANQPALAARRFREINDLVAARSWAYREPADLIALGRVALRLGADPKTVLERLYNMAQQIDPNFRDTWLASGELALEKHDFALAAKTFTEALKKIPDDADILCGLARAYQPNARPKMSELATAALTQNENHIPSLLLLADHLVDAEEYDDAEKLLTRTLKVNPWHPEAWAYRAVIAHLRNDTTAETTARSNALRYWKTNPNVDHLIGSKLSQNYRFAEGSDRQRQALAFAPDFLPARIQLAEDLLRLGHEAEGWQFAEQVHQEDAYDVTAYNLITLRGTMQKFQTLTNDHFILRMATNEAALYGDRALALLERAKMKLTTKYGITLEPPIVIEIFPDQKDFGVRTFGMPHNPGFLGVCFGRVVTANSPASQGGNPSNWEAVLWHEFTHVVTLQMTKNKMPRWLSEGISVHEELQANPAWGQTMNPRYREMILGTDLTPVGELSSAFMSPKSDLHVQFAYYQSALVVEFLVSQFGLESLKAILADLAAGSDINNAIAKHTAPMKQIEKDFRAFAVARAKALGPELDWEKPDESRFLLPGGGEPPREITNLVGAKNYWVLMDRARKLISDKNWTEAIAPLKKLTELYPDQSGPDNAYALLAMVYRHLQQTAQERAALEKWATLEADALNAYLRLMELGEATSDWPTVARNAERTLAVNPLLPQPHRSLGRAAEELGDAPCAIESYQKLLRLDPIDPADIHFRLAKLLRAENEPAAKRHVLQALEEAPRFLAAHKLLLELARAETSPTNSMSLPTP